MLGLAVALVTFFTFDFAFDSYRAWNLKSMTIALGINGLAYILPAFYWFGNGIFKPSTNNPLFIPLAVVITLFILHFTFSHLKGWKHPVTYALGNFLPAVPALFAPVVSGRPFSEDIFVFWLVLAYYEAIGAAYVETRLAFKRFPKKYPLIAWLPIFGVLAYNPYLIMALIEPTVRLVENLREENYVAKMKDIKRLGWSVFKSVMLLYTIILAVLYFT